MINKKVIVCDLDGTLAPSKSTLSPEMSQILSEVLQKYYLVVVSGAAFPQFETQFLRSFRCPKELYRNLFLFPTMGTTCYVYDYELDGWKQIYDELLSEEEKNKIRDAFEWVIKESGLDLSGSYGELIEERGGQVTFSALGQNAPYNLKKDWDKDQTKRKFLIENLKKRIPEFEIRMGGSTSIDVTRKGLDKAYTIQKIKDILSVGDEDMIFIGDALYSGGNDEAVKKTGVDFIQPRDPEQTIEILKGYI